MEHLFPVCIYMITLKMLDATNQCNMNIYHIDGSYHITINNFPLFDRTNMNRRFFLLIVYIILQPFKFVE